MKKPQKKISGYVAQIIIENTLLIKALRGTMAGIIIG
jgi:hypothetical protein